MEDDWWKKEWRGRWKWEIKWEKINNMKEEKTEWMEQMRRRIKEEGRKRSRGRTLLVLKSETGSEELWESKQFASLLHWAFQCLSFTPPIEPSHTTSSIPANSPHHSTSLNWKTAFKGSGKKDTYNQDSPFSHPHSDALLFFLPSP